MYRLPPVSDIGHIIDYAVRIDDAVGGCLQLVEDGGRAIRVVLERGLKPEYFERYRIVRSGFRTSCAQAFTERRRVVIRDVRSDPAYETLRDIAEEAGYRSVQTTPLIDAQRNFHGLFSTYFDRPHHPGPDSLRELDRCSHLAMLVLQALWLQERVAEADGRLGIKGRALPPAGAHAAGAAARLLPTLSRNTGNEAMALEAAITNMETVVGALSTLLKKHCSAPEERPVLAAAVGAG